MRSVGLWKDVQAEGWIGLDAHLHEQGEPEFDSVKDAGDYGCSCGWEGVRRDLVQLGWDGQPLPDIHPRQERVA